MDTIRPASPQQLTEVKVKGKHQAIPHAERATRDRRTCVSQSLVHPVQINRHHLFFPNFHWH